MSAQASGVPGDDFRLPDVGEGLESAEIVEWLVREGEAVQRDQPLVEILTDKSQTQLPSPKSGVIRRLRFAEGDLAEVGQVIVEFESVGAEQGSSPAPPPAEPPVAPRSIRRRRPKASPAVRRRALENEIDLSTVEGTGPGGRITMGDLDATRHRPSASDSSPRVRSEPSAHPLGQLDPGRHRLRGIRRVTAMSMTQALAIPHIHGNDELDATALLSGRRRIKQLHPERAASLTPLAFFVMAVADALRCYPLVNASITIDHDQGHIDVHPEVNIGIAVATGAGLVVPVIRDADRRSLFGLADEIRRLTTTARDRSIPAEELRGGTCTITNFGSLGGRFATPMIRPPEAAIVGFGSIRERPFVVDGNVAARMTLPISVAVDHRLIDGDVMTAFQEHIIGLLTDPVALLAAGTAAGEPQGIVDGRR
jgi:pyruvate dehydrogenase E2 component (dihydrolipoamide acetyltransferase)